MAKEVDVDDVLDVLCARRGLDFHLYRRSTIERRLRQRLSTLHVADLRSYIEVLEREPVELDHLIAHLTLKVTGFFRNPAVFDLLRTTVLPALLVDRGDLSIWSAGCATGEEPYSIAAILYQIATDPGRFRKAITATDIDDRALRDARAARYSASSVQDLSGPVVGRLFSIEQSNRGPIYELNNELRGLVHFAKHNLVDGSPLPLPEGATHFDLVLCRNVLIYFERPLQHLATESLDMSLRPGGYLVLGEAESLPADFDLRYQCLDRRGRIYRKLHA